MKNDERRIRGLRMAFELSVSGLYANSHEIESALQRAGYTDAHEWLDGNSIREELERECDRAKSGFEPGSGNGCFRRCPAKPRPQKRSSIIARSEKRLRK